MPKTIIHLTALEPRLQPTVGGGFANLVGQYFNNDSLSGSPAFSRGDNRIDFDWGTALAPGGSRSPGYRDVGIDSFSARWSGQLLPAFSETYTVHATADDGVRVLVNGTPVIDQWTAAGSFTGTYALQAGQTYAVAVEYREVSGVANVRIAWSSPSTPLEVIEAPSASGYNISGREPFMFADAMKNARALWTGIGGASVGNDANGWPTGDGEMIVWEGAGDAYFSGTYAARFTGQANVSGSPGGDGGIRYRIPGNPTLYYNLTPAQIYNAATNTSTFEIVVPNNAFNSPYTFRVTNSRRLPTDTTATGVTDVEIMRPQTIGGNNPYPFGTLFRDNFKEAASVFTHYRWLDINGDLSENEWSQRTLPTWGRISSPRHQGVTNKEWTWEYQIQFANETGKDLYITMPMRASNDYMRNLARLIRYGSRADGTVCTSDADSLRAYPGLNPNLRAYVELSNEVWNSSGPFWQTRQADDDAVAAGLAPAGSALRAEWDIVNYDGTLNTTDTGGANTFDFRRLGRWYALRSVRMSEQFRAEFGDAAMGERIRPVLYWQYNNANNTAFNALKFLDDTFNNAAGNIVPTPRPVNYYLWGAGGASYYGSPNPQGRLDADPITNPSFDVTQGLPLNAATPRPNSVTGWNFSGNSGVVGRAPSAPANFSADGRTLNGVPNPSIGDYSAYLMRSQGSDPASMISRTIRIDTPGRYALGFTLRYSNGWQYNVPLDFHLDGVRVTPQYLPYRGTGEASPSSGPATVAYSWNIDAAAVWSSQLTTATVAIDVPAGGRDVVFTVSAAPVVAGQWDTAFQQEAYALFDNFYLASVDAVFAAGMPNTGQANGLVGSGDWTRDRAQIAQYAQAYGLVPASYEAGFSLGGDNGASAFQSWLKYTDPRTKSANDAAVDIHAQAGYGLVSYGVYEQWRDWNLANAAAAPLRQSFDFKNQSLPAAPTNGISVPFVLRAAQQSLGQTGSGTNWSYTRTADPTLTAGEFITWNLLVPATGTYTVAAFTSGGTPRLTMDEATVSGMLMLTKGLHTLKLRSAAGNVVLDRIEVSAQGAPASPTLAAPTAVDRVSLSWTAVAGATGYRILYGTVPNTYTQSIDVGSVTSFDVAGLLPQQPYYFAVAAVNASGPSLPSNERQAILIPEGVAGNLAAWEFTGRLGNEANAPVGIASGRVVVSPITRGPGLVPSNDWVPQYFPNRFTSFSNNNVWAQTLPASVTRGQYYQFSVAGVPGQAISLDQLNVSAWFSHTDADNGAGISASTDGTTFTPLALSGSVGPGYSADLSSLPRNSTGTVIFRVYVFGPGDYTATGLGFGTSANDVAVIGSAKTIPAVNAVMVDDGSSQRSRVRTLTVTFNTLVNLGGAAFDLRPQPGGVAVPLTVTTADVGGRTIATLRFAALDDGRWRLTTVATQITHRLGDVAMASNSTHDFHRFYGDIDGNATVDGQDFAEFGTVFGRTIDSPFDYDGNGVIDGGTDFTQFGMQFGKTL